MASDSNTTYMLGPSGSNQKMSNAPCYALPLLLGRPSLIPQPCLFAAAGRELGVEQSNKTAAGVRHGHSCATNMERLHD